VKPCYKVVRDTLNQRKVNTNHNTERHPWFMHVMPFLPYLYFTPTHVFFYEMLILTTVSKGTHGRFLQLIHIKRSTVLDSNVVAPLTAVVWPMITDCTRHYAVYDRRMLPIYPSWGMRTTMVYSWTLSGHLWVTRNASKAIPSRVDISLIASGWTSVSDKAICCIKVVVVAAWVRNCNCWHTMC